MKTFLVSRDIYGSDEPLALVSAKTEEAARDIFWENVDEDLREAIGLDDWAPALGREPVTYAELDLKAPFVFIGAVA